MQQTDFQRFKALMNGIAKLYERELDGPVLDAYWVALRDWDLGDFEASAGQLMRTSKFMPRPADFEELRRAGRLTAGEAWANARACWRSGGSGTGDSLTDRVVRMLGGYRSMGLTATDQMAFLERRFAEHYAQLQEVEEVREAVPQIAYQRSSQISGPAGVRKLFGNGALRRLGEPDGPENGRQ